MAKAFRANALQVTADAWILQGAVDPTTGGGVAAPVNSNYYQTATGLVWHKVGAGNTDWVLFVLPSIFGDGSDGDVVLPGGTTVLTRNMFYRNLTVPAGAILEKTPPPAGSVGLQIYVLNTLTVEVGGIIRGNGATATTFTGFVGNTSGTWYNGGGSSGNGNIGAGSAGAAVAQVLQGAVPSGGAGGAGAGGAGGAGGVATNWLAADGGPLRDLIGACIGHRMDTDGATPFATRGGAGGGGGGGNGAASQGGAGGGGGVGVFICARNVVNNGAIEGRGGDGAPGVAANCGGGGGGGGGIVLIVRRFFTGTVPNVSGGAGGASGGGAGVAGTAGTAGLVLQLQA